MEEKRERGGSKEGDERKDRRKRGRSVIRNKGWKRGDGDKKQKRTRVR